MCVLFFICNFHFIFHIFFSFTKSVKSKTPQKNKMNKILRNIILNNIPEIKAENLNELIECNKIVD